MDAKQVSGCEQAVMRTYRQVTQDLSKSDELKVLEAVISALEGVETCIKEEVGDSEE